MTDIMITINGRRQQVRDDDQEAAALLRLDGRDPRREDLFLLTEHGLEELVRDNQIINLLDGQRFRSRRKVRFTIDGEAHESYDDDQSAAALIRLAGLEPREYDLALVRAGEEIQTFADDAIVELADDVVLCTAKRIGPVA